LGRNALFTVHSLTPSRVAANKTRGVFVPETVIDEIVEAVEAEKMLAAERGKKATQMEVATYLVNLAAETSDKPKTEAERRAEAATRRGSISQLLNTYKVRFLFVPCWPPLQYCSCRGGSFACSSWSRRVCGSSWRSSTKPTRSP
jgi:hypothetical protein